jgi:hypothetical protein
VLELLVDLLVCDLDSIFGHLDALVLPQSGLGSTGDRGGELEAFVFVERLVEVDLRPVYRPEVGLDDRLGDQVGSLS